MLRALAHPLSLLVLAASFLVGIVLHGWVQALVADRFGDRRPRLEGRLNPSPKRHVDPFGAVAALLSGVGWGRPVDLPTGIRRRTAQVVVALSGPAVNLALGAGILALWRVGFGPAGSASGGSVAYVATQVGAFGFLQQGTSLSVAGLPTAVFLFGCAQLYFGALTLVPLPPMDGGNLLFALGPRSPAWHKAQHHLVERNLGLVALLALLLIPLGGNVPILPQVLDSVLTPLVRVITGG
ncbi:MAG: peptidase [Frankiales bacterium]|nr:peptidase [Frankiales bacterium]